MEGLSSGTVYEGRPPGNGPQLMPWDASLNQDVNCAIGRRVPFCSVMESTDPDYDKRFTRYTPKSQGSAYLRILGPVHGPTGGAPALARSAHTFSLGLAAWSTPGRSCAALQPYSLCALEKSSETCTKGFPLCRAFSMSSAPPRTLIWTSSLTLTPSCWGASCSATTGACARCTALVHTETSESRALVGRRLGDTRPRCPRVDQGCATSTRPGGSGAARPQQLGVSVKDGVQIKAPGGALLMEKA